MVKDRLNAYLDELSAKCAFKDWYFGHYHVDSPLTGGYRAIYTDIVRII